jgi:hypothetical protein
MKSVVGLSVFLLLLSAVFCTAVGVTISPTSANVEIGTCTYINLTPSPNDGNITITATSTSYDVTFNPAQAPLAGAIAFQVCARTNATV